MDLEPGDAEGHHHIGHGVGLGEQVGDLFTGADVPVGHAGGLHLLLRPVGQAPALTDRLHDLEGPLGGHPLGDEEQHDVVAAADGLADGDPLLQDQVPGVAQPHVGAVGEAGQPDQNIELVGLGLLQHPPNEGGSEFRDGGAAGGAQNFVVLIAQRLGGLEDGHGVRVVQRDLPGVYSRQHLQHSDHGGIIVAQHVQLQQVGLHGVVFKMGGDDVAVRVVGGVLDGTEVIDLLVLGDDHHAAGVLSGGPLDSGTAQSQPVLLRLGGRQPPLRQILFHIAEGGLLRHGADGPRPEHMGLAEELEGIAVGAGLVLAGEVQVDIGDLVAAKAQEGLEGDVEAVLHILGPAHRADGVGHIGAAAVGVLRVLGIVEVGVFAVGTAVVGGQGVHLGDARHEGHQRGAHAASGAHQIAVLQGILDQLLGGHVDHVVFAADDVAQLRLDPVHHDLGRVLPVQVVGLAPDQPLQLPVGVLQLGGEQALGQRVDGVAAVGDEVGVLHHHLVGLLLAQVGELLQHLVGGLQVDGQRLVRVLKALGGQENVAVHLVLRVQEVDVPGGAHRLAQLLPQPDHGPVEVTKLLLRLHHALAEHEHVVADGLDLQVIVPGGDPLQLLPALALHHRLEQLAGLAGRADDESLPVFVDEGLGHDGVPLEMLQIGQGDQLVQVAQPRLVLGQDDQMLGLPLGLAPLAELGHIAVDLPQVMEPQFLHHPEEVGQHIGHRGRVVAGPVVVEGGQLQPLGNDIQLVLAQVGQQVLGQDQAVHRGVVEGDAVLLTAGGDKAHVKLRVVGGKRPVPGKDQKRLQRLLLGGGAHQHLVGDAGELDDLRRQDAARRHEGVEAVGNLPVFQYHRADLNDDLILLVQSGGLNVKADDLPVEGLTDLPVDGHPVVHVVDVVGLHAEENLHLLGRVPRVGEGVGHAVVGDGDGGMAPFLQTLDGVFRHRRIGLGPHRRQCVHGGHGGVEMELHPLLLRRVHPHRLFRLGHGHRLQHHVAVKAVQVQTALDLQVHSLLDAVHQGLALVAGEELVDPDGAGIVGHVKGHHPGAPLFQLLVVHGEDVALHHHHAHVQLQLSHSHGRLGDGLAEDGLAPRFFPVPLGGGGMGHVLHGRFPQGFRPGEGVGGGALLPGNGLGRAFPSRGGGGYCGRFHGSRLRGLDLHAVQAVGPAQGLLRLPDQIGSGSRRAFHQDLGAAAALVDGGGHNEPALHRVGQLGPAAQGGKHLQKGDLLGHYVNSP